MIDFTKLKDIREDNDLTQEDMANILKVKRSAYSLWELGINVIPLKYLIAFANHFNYSIDYVLGLNNNKQKNNLLEKLDLKVLGENLKQLRIKNNLSQANLAKMLNVKQACIAKYENANICISISNLYKYSKKFKVSMNNLCSKSEKEESVLKKTNN